MGAGTRLDRITVNPAPLLAIPVNVNVSATADAPFNGPSPPSPMPFGNATSYSVTTDWGDGNITVRDITGSGTLAVSGAHTYADPSSYSLSVQISQNFRNTTTATICSTANVTSLGQAVPDGLAGGIGFMEGV